MSPLRRIVSPLACLLAAALVASACTTGGGGGFGGFQSIFEEDLTARQPVEPQAPASEDVAVLGTGEAVYHGSAQDEREEANATVSSFEPDEFNLNFQNADIREVVQSILGNALGENYTIDPSIAGSVTISSARPISRDDLIPALEVILQMSGAALVIEGEVYRVVPEAAAVAGTADLGEGRPGYGLTILPLKYVSAQTLIQLIEGFGVRPGAVRAEAARNLLIVLGNSADRKAAIETALTFDADWMQDQSVAVLPLRHARPEAIIPELERIFSSRAGSVGADLITFMPMQRLRAILAVSPRGNLIERARTWVRRLDNENPDLNASVHVYRVKYRDARKLAELVSRLFSGGGGIAGEEASEQVEPGADAVSTEGFTDGFGQNAQGGQEFDQGFTDPTTQELVAGGDPYASPTPIVVGDGATAEDPLADTGGGVRIQADIANNSIVIYADLETRKEILTALERIDVPQLQVAINVTMAEIRLVDELRYGIQYFIKSESIGLGEDEGSLGLFNTLSNNIGRELPGFNFVVGSAASPDIIIDAFDRITDVNVLSSPSLVVVQNEVAKFQVGDQIPIVTRTVTSVQDPEAPVSNEIEYRDTGIILNIKPRIADNGTVNLDIGQEISSVTAGSATLTPTISNRAVESTVSVVDGQTVLLGGLISEQTGKERAGIPGLHRLPAIGNLFGRKSQLNNRTELIILIKPTVIRSSEDAQHVAQELRSRLWGLGSTNAR